MTAERRRRPAATVLAVLAVGFAVSLCLGCTARVRTAVEAVPEGVEAVVSDAERPLREELRPIRGTTRLLVFAIDGLGRERMSEVLSSVKAPETRRLAGAGLAGDARFEHGYLVPDTLSILPSSTIAAWTTIFTGQVPAQTGVTGNEFFIRETERFYAIAPTSVPSRLHALEAVNDGLLNDLIGAPTLYERAGLRAHVSLSPIYRGGDVFTKSESPFLKMLVRAAVNGMDGDQQADRSGYAAIDEESFDSMQDAWEDHGLPDIQTVYLPGLDLFSHVARLPHLQQTAYFEDVIEPIVSRVLDEYRRRQVLDDTWVMFISDHGHTPVIADAEHALEAEDFDEPLARAKFQLRPAGLEAPDESYSAVLASQGGLGYLYLANRAACTPDEGCDWAERPRWTEDVQPLVETLDRYNRDPEGLAGKLDLILARDPADPRAPFRAWSDGQWREVPDVIAAAGLDHQVELDARLRDLTDGPYGHLMAEVVLVPRYGMQYPESERYYFAMPMHSEHGSGTIEDGRFTWLVTHARKSGVEIQRIVNEVTSGRPRQQHFLPLALRLLEIDPDPKLEEQVEP